MASPSAELRVTDGPDPEPGLYLACPEKKYRSWNAVSQSLLQKAVSPRAVKLLMEEDHFEYSSAMKVGSAVDARWFGLDEDHYVDTPETYDMRTKVGKEWKAKQEGKVILSKDEAKKCQRCLEALCEHPASKDIMDTVQGDGSWVQPSAVAEVLGTLCKGRADVVTEDGVIWDLKTYGRQLRSERQAGYWARDRGYHLQAALYMRLFASAAQMEEAPSGFGWIVVETNFPWEVSVWRASESLIREGESLLTERMRNVADWRRGASGFSSPFVETIS